MINFLPGWGVPPGALVCGQMSDCTTPLYAGTVTLLNPSPGMGSSSSIVLPGCVMKDGILFSIDGQQRFAATGDIKVRNEGGDEG